VVSATFAIKGFALSCPVLLRWFTSIDVIDSTGCFGSATGNIR
jgi:hypothetical protein